MKKILAICLSVVFVIALAAPIFAVPASTIAVNGSKTTVEAGDKLVITVDLESNPGINGATIWLYYDEASFTIKKTNVKQGSIWADAADADALTVVKNVEDGAAKISIGSIWTDEEDESVFLNSEDNGSVAEFTFTAKDDIKPGKHTFYLNDDPTTFGDKAELLLTNVEKDKWTPTATAFTVTVPGEVAEEVTFTAGAATVDASNIAGYVNEGEIIVPVPVIASGINADNGIAAFRLGFSCDAEIASIEAGSAIPNTDQFKVGPLTEGSSVNSIWVDTTEITAANAEIAIVNVKVPHGAEADTVYALTLIASEDADDYLLVDETTYDVVTANGSVTLAIDAHIAGEAAREDEVPATCTVDGSYNEVVRCTIGGEIISSEPKTITAPGHDFGDWFEETAPTCTEAGVERRDCKNCDEYETRPINALGHKFGDWFEETAPTCTEAGVERRDCENCDEYETRPINALGHTLTHFDAVAATAEAAGNIEYWKCSVCQKYFSDAEGTNEITEEATIVPKLSGIKGDVDGDGHVNAQDVILIMRYMVGWRDVVINVDMADYNEDSKLNNRDVYDILKDIVNGVVS